MTTGSVKQDMDTGSEIANGYVYTLKCVVSRNNAELIMHVNDSNSHNK